MARKKTPAPTTIATRDELEARMTLRTQRFVERQRLAATLNKKLADIRANYEEMFARLDAEIAAADADLEAWAALHPSEFARRRSIDLLNGTLGYRTCPPAVKTRRGVRVDDAVRLLVDANRMDLVAQRITLNKDAILDEANRAGADVVAPYGLRIVQDEKFYIESRTDKQEAS